MKKHSNNKMTLARLAQEMRDGFSELRQDIKDINTRIDQIDARLDYNGLKRLPENNK